MARLRERQTEKAYRAYVTDALKAIAENTARYVVYGVKEPIECGSVMQGRWIEMFQPRKKPEPEDNRSCVEIAHDIFQRMRRKRKVVEK